MTARLITQCTLILVLMALALHGVANSDWMTFAAAMIGMLAVML